VIITLLFSVIALSIERFFALRTAFGKSSLGKFVINVKQAITAGDMAKAQQLCDKQQGSVANVVGASIAAYKEMENTPNLKRAAKVSKIQQAHEEATQLEMPTLQMNMPIIATIVTLGTLTALFGTVVGMIRSFAALASGVGNGRGSKGDNLNGEYRAPNGTGDGSGHILGKDTYGNYDRSTTAKGLANKKGIDTAFVQADTVVLGSIEPEVLRKILQEYLPQFKFCYQQELSENSEKIKGIVDLNFRIEPDGKVSVVNIKSASTKFSQKGISCMGNILHMIEFPKPKGGGLVDVRQPLNFLSESTKI
jgi:hypothetical protein